MHKLFKESKFEALCDVSYCVKCLHVNKKQIYCISTSSRSFIIIIIIIIVTLFILCTYIYIYIWGTPWRSWLRHSATNRKVAGSMPNGVTGIFH